MVLTLTDRNKVYNIINKSPGLNKVPTDVLKCFASDISDPLAHIFNLSVEKGVFPFLLKGTVLVLLYKGGNRSKVSDYRPISLTTHLSKIFVKLLKKINIIFRKKSSTFLKRV